MKYLQICDNRVNASEIILGFSRIENLSSKELDILVKTALDAGINFFDHADGYGLGKCETLFGDSIKFNSSMRESVYIQTKCGIRKDIQGYDLSKEHIVKSCEKSLERLKTEYVDVLLLHRIDPLYEPDEVAEAFEKLYSTGKVRYFGVSNTKPMQIEMLNSYLGEKRIMINQLQFSLMHACMINSAVLANSREPDACDRDGELIDYCRLKRVTIQAWSPIQYGFLMGAFLDNEDYPELNAVLNRIAEEKGVSNSAIALAWILRHPARMQVVIGTTTPDRVTSMSKASGLELSREEWWELYCAAGNLVL